MKSTNKRIDMRWWAVLAAFLAFWMAVVSGLVMVGVLP